MGATNTDLIEAATCLIVDDEIANVGVLKQMLEQWGCVNVVSTTDPQEALSLYTGYQPDIVLLDLMMPYLDGFTVMEQLRRVSSAASYLPILVLTADTSTPIKLRALAAGASDFLTKPFDAVELSLRIRTLLQTRFLQVELAEQNRLLETKVQQRTEDLAQAEIDATECLALAAEFRDDATGHHTHRVGQTAALLADHLGLDAARVTLIRRAAPLHDVGKIGVPDAVLLKPGKLTDEEFVVMRRHAEIGARILGRHRSPLLQLAAQIALTHHERWNGAGYPHQLAGDAISLEGRIVALADVFDALTHARPYKPAWPAKPSRRSNGRAAASLTPPWWPCSWNWPGPIGCRTGCWRMLAKAPAYQGLRSSTWSAYTKTNSATAACS